SAAFAQLLDSARRAGFHVKVVETYRTPEREASLLAERRGLTYTATSMHSYGRAIDIEVGDGNWQHKKTRDEWIRFRALVAEAQGRRCRLVEQANDTWEWRHVDLPSP